MLRTATKPTNDQAGARRRVAGSIGVLTLGDFINKTTRFVAVVLFTRALPLDQYGLLNLGVALAGIAVVVIRLGLPDLGAREVAIAEERREELAGRIVTPQAAGMLALTTLACAGAFTLAPGAAPFVLLTGATSLGLALSGDWLLRGMERMLQLSIATAFGGLVTLAGAIVVSASSQSATAGLAAIAVGELAAAALTWRWAKLRRLPRPTLRGLGGMLRESWPLAITGAVTYAYLANIDTLLLAATRSVDEAGLYSAPYRLFLALNATGIFAAYALLPLAARAHAASAADEAERLVMSCLPPLAGFGLLCLGSAELLGGGLLETLFGAPFGAMATTFILLCAAIPWYAVGYPVGYSAIASGHHRRLLAGASVAAALNVGLNLILIPPMGPEGAAVATTVAMVAGAVTWLAGQHLLKRVTPLVAVLLLSTAAACVATLAEAARIEIAAGTLVAGAWLLVAGGAKGVKRLLAERWASP